MQPFLVGLDVGIAWTAMEPPRVDRRLAAVLEADVVGYSRLIERDEIGTLQRLKALRKQVIEPVLARHEGRIIKLLGDGALVEFPSAAEAVQAAVEVQRAVVDHEQDRPEAERLRFRIGISLGDLVHEDGDIFGEGVNLAARLEQLAEPGGICIARNVYEQARNRLPVAFAPMGRQRLKHLADPVEVFAVHPVGTPARRGALLRRRFRFAVPVLGARPGTRRRCVVSMAGADPARRERHGAGPALDRCARL